MKHELDLIRANLKDSGDQLYISGVEQRKGVRLMTDSLISEALMANSLTELPKKLAQTMLVVATVLVMRESEPEVDDFVTAAVALIQDARKQIDNGLQTNDDEVVRVGSVMMEIVVRGIFHDLGLNYEAALKEETA